MASLEEHLDQWTQNAMDPKLLTEAEKDLRDRFAREYILDYDAYAACLRVGFLSSFAPDWCKKFMSESYVRCKIQELELARNGNISDQLEIDKTRVRAMLFAEANYHGPGSSHGARVSALAKLTAMLGMDAPTKTEATVNVKNPVQFYLPDNGRTKVEPK